MCQVPAELTTPMAPRPAQDRLLGDAPSSRVALQPGIPRIIAPLAMTAFQAALVGGLQRRRTPGETHRIPRTPLRSFGVRQLAAAFLQASLLAGVTSVTEGPRASSRGESGSKLPHSKLKGSCARLASQPDSPLGTDGSFHRNWRHVPEEADLRRPSAPRVSLRPAA